MSSTRALVVAVIVHSVRLPVGQVDGLVGVARQQSLQFDFVENGEPLRFQAAQERHTHGHKRNQTGVVSSVTMKFAVAYTWTPVLGKMRHWRP